MAGEKCELEKLQEHAELARRRILEQDDDGDASPFAGALLVLSSHLQLLAAAVDEGAARPTWLSMSSSCSPCAATSTAMSLNTWWSSSRLRSST
ncbi:hypothetical protein GUJ93_ZPchr0001g32801 [Zizania palustris]|uniref:Uncharacterized protein n=1 Tax=Zizania palustris TaxID=103762 RepID=A0A8J5VQU7_ZIZPA|nr:hypothetical protein GUJ93_ZPchr0001g32801 [Zizania palustris]